MTSGGRKSWVDEYNPENPSFIEKSTLYNPMGVQTHINVTLKGRSGDNIKNRYGFPRDGSTKKRCELTKNTDHIVK